MDFKVGDVVVLKSGGPKMTVAENYENGWYLAHWFSNNNLNKGEFKVDTLIQVFVMNEDVEIDIHK